MLTPPECWPHRARKLLVAADQVIEPLLAVRFFRLAAGRGRERCQMAPELFIEYNTNSFGRPHDFAFLDTVAYSCDCPTTLQMHHSLLLFELFAMMCV